MTSDSMGLESGSDDSQNNTEVNEEEEEEEEMSDLDLEVSTKRKVKETKPGVVYLSTLPYGMSSSAIKTSLSNFGEIGNTFFQMADRENFVGGLSRGFVQPKKFRKAGRLIKGKIRYTEAWVEFLSRRRARLAAETLNNTQVGGRKKSSYYDCLWSVKYNGGRFKWAQLRHRIEYEKEIHKRKMTNEIRKVTEETDQYTRASEIADRIQKKQQKNGEQGVNSLAGGASNSMDGVRQRLTEQEIQQKKQEKERKNLKFKAKLQKSKNKKQQQKQIKRDERLETVRALGAM